MTHTLTLDGSAGGGQLLRTALSLSLITGTPFHMTNIRGARKPRPGLMRQHLTCVLAAAEIGGAKAGGAELGSRELRFVPGKIRAGDYRFAIGTGGSTTLVLQTLLPALLHADGPSTLRIEGGTHNPLAPPFEFIDRCFLPQLRRMGATVEVALEKPGFMQAGGGAITAAIQPLKKWKPLTLLTRGEDGASFGQVLHAHLPQGIAQRERQAAARVLEWPEEHIALCDVAASEGPGSIVLLGHAFENVTELCSAVAQLGKTAEAVGSTAAKQLRNYLGSAAVAGVPLADQLLLPMALAGGGELLTLTLSNHIKTSLELIPRFLPVRFATDPVEGGGVKIAVHPACE